VLLLFLNGFFLCRQIIVEFFDIYCRRFLIIKKTILKPYLPKKTIWNVDFALELKKKIELFYMSQMNPKEFVHNTT